MADGVAVLDDVFAFGNVADQYLVASGRVLVQYDAMAIHADDVTLLLLREAYHDGVGRVDFEESSLLHFLKKYLFGLYIDGQRY